MNDDQKEGLLIFVISLTLIAVALVMSDNWGTQYNLILFSWETTVDRTDPHWLGSDTEWHAILTKYVVALLLVAAGYGVTRYFSLVRSFFRKKK